MSEKSRTEVNNWFKILGICDDDVISVSERSHRVLKLRYAMSEILGKFTQYIPSWLPSDVVIDAKKWFDGTACEVLKVGAKGWQKGRVKLSLVLEFVPDTEELLEISGFDDLEAFRVSEVRSPLDDIRQMDI
jgi:hypothetical protein